MKRRHFLWGAMVLSPLAILKGGADGLINRLGGLLSKDRKELKTYVMLNLYGAPTRWLFDNCLQPRAGDKLRTDKMLYTNYSANQLDHYDPMTSPVEYTTVSYGDRQVPRLWSSNVYFRGDLVPMTRLLPNMLTVRGVWQGINSHPAGNIRQICVRTGSTSISGLVADSSRRPIPALSLGGSPAGLAYKSEAGTPQLDIGYENSSPGSNLIHYVTRSFTNEELNLPSSFDAFKEWDRLVGKYTQIVDETKKRCPIFGLTDKPFFVQEFSAASREELLNAINRFKIDGSVMIQNDFKPVFAEMEIGQNRFIEKQFAFAEFMLLNKLSSSLVLSPPRGDERAISNLKSASMFQVEELKIIEDAGRFKLEVPKPRGEQTLAVKLDNHGGGSFFGILGHSLFFQGYSACLLELVQTLKDHSTAENDLFADTVIHLASEFDRSVPQMDGTSDHFASANPTSLISGMIEEYKLIGNVKVKSEYWGNSCTFGEAAPVAELHGEIVRSENILSSITTVLGGRRLSFRHPSVLGVKNGRIVTQFKNPKNVDEA